VWGATMRVNVSSQKVMDKIGMTVAEAIPTPDCMQMVQGAEQGGLLYEITKDRWHTGRGTA
jgi:RimJ/RimL family protein N-acetyltransferase